MIQLRSVTKKYKNNYALKNINLDILSDLPPETTTSMQRDVMAHKPSELEGLVFEVVRMGQKYHVPVPMYEKVAEKLKALI